MPGVGTSVGSTDVMRSVPIYPVGIEKVLSKGCRGSLSVVACCEGAWLAQCCALRVGGKRH